ncbi:hypothetical protein DNTS_028700 [Danionella cerebrum]|uniref:Poly [ADP-ribose] polymerase n=1 Tax=Danionella cerebrum TaxID=2873325 RepID=A0A553NGY7_9TELE|nr:hypothetical protein DNTS_028700 [Danionella translucida]
MTDYFAIIRIATSILCSNKGSMEISELHRRVLQVQNVSEADLWYTVCKCARFTVAQSTPRANDGESDCIIVAKTSLRICKKYSKNECDECKDLHLCKFYVFWNCRYGKGRKECNFSHDIHSQHNFPLLRECRLHELNEDGLFLLLLQNDPSLLPEVCIHYSKGTGVFGDCTFKERCSKLHLCLHFVQGRCKFGSQCKRLHSITKHSRSLLEERGIIGEIINDLPYIYQNAYRLNPQAFDGGTSAPSCVQVQTVPQTEENEICLHFLRHRCKFNDQCSCVHFNLPYKWEVFDGTYWRDLTNQEEIEQAYCDPRNELSPGSQPVNFVSMSRFFDPVRRLSTASSVCKPKHYILTTEWLWYYKGDRENWIEYGVPDDKNRVTSVTSTELERAFQMNSTSEVTVSKGKRHYYISFRDMYQRNPKHNTKRRVRRRPRFVSMKEVEAKAAQ